MGGPGRLGTRDGSPRGRPVTVGAAGGMAGAEAAGVSRGRARGWLATILLAAAPASAQAPGVRVIYLANEGVILEGAGGRVLIDALFGDGLPEYAVVARPSRDSLERGLAHYGGPVVVLATHAHRDHYDSAAVARYLRSNPEAAAVGVPGAAPHKVGPIELGWVKARPVVIPHGPTRRPVEHTGWIV